MSKVAFMREKRGEIWDKAKAFLTEHTDENGMMNAEDTAEYERMEKEIENYARAIEREERAERIERDLNAPTARALTSRPEDGPAEKPGRASNDYRSAFWQMVRDRGAGYSVYNALQIGTDTEGGYLVPDEYERRLLDSLEDANIMRGLCTVIRTESGDRKIPLVTSHGTASWVEEEGVIPDSDDAFGQITLGAHKLGTIIKVSDELLQDSMFDIESYIARQFGRRIGAAEEEAFLTGDGSAKPIGLLNGTNGAAVGVTTAGAAFTSDELIDLVHSVRAVYRKDAVFVMNDATIKELRKLKDGNGRYLWEPGLKEGQPDRLLNYRVINSAFMPEVAAGAKPILFGDFSGYWIADRQARSFQRLNELYATTGQIGFRATQRVDGRLVEPDKIRCLQMKA